MTPAYLQPFATHLWQSSLFAGVAGLIAHVLRKNGASLRCWLWLTASAKFLVPFSLLINLGSRFGWRLGSVTARIQVSSLMGEIGQSFVQAPSVSLLAPTPQVPSQIPTILFGMWFCGFALAVFCWLRAWLNIRAAMRKGSPSQADLTVGRISVKVIDSPSLLEPCVFGIFRPVLLLPNGIRDRLTPDQLKAIFLHELCHVRRRDNLAAAVHMVVETLFWFYPLVYWIGKRLMDERETACDEEVLCVTGAPETYADGILAVCRFALQSSTACAAGVMGSNLKQRIQAIISNRVANRLDWRRKVLLATAGVLALTAPNLIGVAYAPMAQAQSPAPARLEFDVASVKPNESGRAGTDGFQVAHGTLAVRNVSLKTLIQVAYKTQGPRILGGPAWLGSDRFDVIAKGPVTATKDQVWLMLQSLLADRFSVHLRRETKELPIYELQLAKGGPKLPKRDDSDCGAESSVDPSGRPSVNPCGALASVWAPQGGVIMGQKVGIPDLASALTAFVDRPVVDRTGLRGTFDVDLRWTPDDYHFVSGQGEGRSVAESPEPGPSIIAAVQEQLGLKLSAARGPVEVLAIDHAEKPSGN
jgi:bla regulator protein blaR1